MYHKLFRITLLYTAIAIILAACGASTPTLAQATTAPIATEVDPTVTKIAPTNPPEPTPTQVVLGVVEGTIAFRSDRDGNDEIYVMNGDGSGQTNLTNNPSDDDLPAWSPDGTRIVYCSHGEINIMNADGSSQTNLTNNSSEDCLPSWSPI